VKNANISSFTGSSQFVDRKLSERHTFAAARPGAEQNDPPRHLSIFRGKLLRDHAAERKPNNVEAV
jgi:hypothetical protein